MNSSALDSEAPDLVCQLDNVQGMVDALTAVRWKRHQVIALFPNFLFGSREKKIAKSKTKFWLLYKFWDNATKQGCGYRIIRARRRFDCRGNRLSSGQSVSAARGILLLFALDAFSKILVHTVWLPRNFKKIISGKTEISY